MKYETRMSVLFKDDMSCSIMHMFEFIFSLLYGTFGYSKSIHENISYLFCFKLNIPWATIFSMPDCYTKMASWSYFTENSIYRWAISFINQKFRKFGKRFLLIPKMYNDTIIYYTNIMYNDTKMYNDNEAQRSSDGTMNIPFPFCQTCDLMIGK